MSRILILPLLLQGFLIMVDEFVFHRRRGLHKWEKWGHPLDTLTFILPLSLAVFFTFESDLTATFIVLSVFSSLFVTKDEFLHAQICEPGEHWLHSLLFLIHPVSFFAVFWLWKTHQYMSFVRLHLTLVVVFLIYQILSGSGLWSQKFSSLQK